MVNFLEKIISVLPEYQRTAIKSLIASKVAAGELLSNRAKEQEANDIFSRIKGNLSSPCLKPNYAVTDNKISSDNINRNMEEIFLDLNALYRSIDSFSKDITNQTINLNSDYYKSKAAIEKLINDVKVYSLRRKRTEFNEVKLIDFNSSSNQSKKQPVATVSPEVRVLELKPLITNRVHLLNRTTRNTKIYTKTYSPGLKGDLSSLFPLENMVDQKPESFWATSILADAPISQIYQKNTGNEEYQIAVEGPVVEIYFKLSHAEKINTIKILPFSEYSTRIVDISYRASNSSQIFIPIENFKESTTLDWEEYNFNPVVTNEVRITIAQENYKKVSYLLPKNLVTNRELFQQILKERALKTISNNIFDSDFSLYVLNSKTTYSKVIKDLETLFTDYGLDLSVQPSVEYYTKLNDILQIAYSDISKESIQTLTNQLNSNEPLQQPDSGNVTISKYEYLLGIREIQINHQLYYPVSFYESEKYLPQATVSEIQIEVDAEHVETNTAWQEDYRKTSIEWELDIGDGRKIPIHPSNLVDQIDTLPCTKDEKINFDLSSYKGQTRLGGYYSTPYRLKKNGEVIPPTYYECVRVTGSIPKLEITLNQEYFDTNSIYTIDYAVDISSYNINILDKFNSEPITTPESFTGVGSNNEITLTNYPFINYEVINLTGFFTKSEDSTWKFISPQQNIYSGQLRIVPAIYDNVGNLIQEGSVTGLLLTGVWGEQSGKSFPSLSGNPNLALNYFGEIQGVDFGYYLKAMDSNLYTEVDQFIDNKTFLLKEPLAVTEDQCRRWDSYATGQVFSGQLTSPVSGQLTIDYSIGVGVKTDGQIYTMSDITYTPITITVGSKEAKNITNYETLVHPAFSISSSKDNEVEYIHAGNKIYFNQKINGQEIRVSYNWLTSYIKLIGTLRYNSNVNPSLTPKVNEIRILMNNLII